MITSRNKAHISQPEGTPFTIAPLKDILGSDSFTPFGNALITGTADLDNRPLSKLQLLYFTKFQKTSRTLDSPFPSRFSRRHDFWIKQVERKHHHIPIA